MKKPEHRREEAREDFPISVPIVCWFVIVKYWELSKMVSGAFRRGCSWARPALIWPRCAHLSLFAVNERPAHTQGWHGCVLTCCSALLLVSCTMGTPAARLRIAPEAACPWHLPRRQHACLLTKPRTRTYPFASTGQEASDPNTVHPMKMLPQVLVPLGVPVGSPTATLLACWFSCSYFPLSWVLQQAQPVAALRGRLQAVKIMQIWNNVFLAV